MVNRKDIQATCDDIVGEFAPLQLILFGSYAYGTPSEYSDVDLLVVMPIANSETRDQAVEYVNEFHGDSVRTSLCVQQKRSLIVSHTMIGFFVKSLKKVRCYESGDFYFKPHKKENTSMNPLTSEWIELAEENHAIARLIQREQLSMRYGMCFHAQLCAEKYLKAGLQENSIPVPRTHNLEELLDLILPTIPSWHSCRTDLAVLSKHAVDTRYVGQSPTAADAENAMRICEKVHQAVREKLKIPNQSRS